MARDGVRMVKLGRFEALPVSGGSGTKADAEIITTTAAARTLLTPAAIATTGGKQYYVTIMSDQDIYFQQGASDGTLSDTNCGLLLKNTYLMVLCTFGFDYLLFKSVDTTGSVYLMHHEFA